ncbi:MAG: tetratricopeptide repeat protein [Chthonomonas sp.]|nr:tetratricopeptide repeat protein [Chthonomonas sp.]
MTQALEQVALLMTDVVGSTRLEQEHGAEFLTWLQRHTELAESLAQEHGGRVLKHRGEGDSIFAAFAKANDAIACARALGIATRQIPNAPTKVAVRMAVDYGSAHALPNDYWGGVVNRCARIREIAQGDQILVSASAAQSSPAEVLPLGIHRLRDVEDPIEIFQVQSDDLPSDFPPIRNLLHIAQLPSYSSSFIGRIDERVQAKKLITEHRLVSIQGPAGAGKTRLGIEVASRTGGDTIYVDLAAADTEDGIIQTLGNRIDPEIGSATIPKLSERLFNRKCLILLDNADGDIRATRKVVSELLASTQSPHILATTREALNIPGERRLVLGPLDEGQLMLMDRAIACGADAPKTEKELDLYLELVQSVDGLPLGIELLAPMLASMTPELVKGLVKEYTALDIASATDDDRHRSLEGVLAGSIGRLESSTQARLAALALFSTFSLEAAAEVWGLSPILAAQVMRELVEKSLVQYESVGGEHGRYRLLKTTKQYLTRHAPASPEAIERFVRNEAQICQRLDAQIRSEQSPASFRAWDEEHANILAALNFAVSHEFLEEAMELIHGLQFYFRFRLGLEVAAQMGRGILKQIERLPPSGQRARFFNDLSTMEMQEGRMSEAEVALNIAIEDAEIRNDLHLQPKMLMNSAVIAWQQGRNLEAIDITRQAAALAEQIGDNKVYASILSNLGALLNREGSMDEAAEILEKSADLHARQGDHAHRVLVYTNLAELNLNRKGPKAALEDLLRAANLAEEIELVGYLGIISALAAIVLVRLGRLDRASSLWANYLAAPNIVIVRDDPIEVGYPDEMRQLEGQSLQPAELNGSLSAFLRAEIGT